MHQNACFGVALFSLFVPFFAEFGELVDEDDGECAADDGFMWDG
jgi:hypothetical protein